MLIRIILLTVLWLTACTPIGTQSPEIQSPKLEMPATSPTVETSALLIQPTVEGEPGPVSREVVENAKADLTKRFDVNAGQIHLTEVKAVTWPDASLGCPQPDLAYAQVLTPGYWILLEADGKQYSYHTDQTDQLILCAEETSIEGTTDKPLPIIPVNPGEIDDGEPWVPVD